MAANVHQLGVSQPWFSHIRDGSKTVEGRLNRGKFQAIKTGHIVVIRCTGHDRIKPLVAVVKDIVRYDTFDQYLSHEGLVHTLPGVHTIREGVQVYRQFYSEEDERTFGIAAIKLTVS
jgi:ASC-1-like (ASCH) protein